MTSFATRIRVNLARQYSSFYLFWSDWPRYVDGVFFFLHWRISCKTYSEPMKHTLSPCKGLVDGFFIFDILSGSLCLITRITWYAKNINKFFCKNENSIILQRITKKRSQLLGSWSKSNYFLLNLRVLGGDKFCPKDTGKPGFHLTVHFWKPCGNSVWAFIIAKVLCIVLQNAMYQFWRWHQYY